MMNDAQRIQKIEQDLAIMSDGKKDFRETEITLYCYVGSEKWEYSSPLLSIRGDQGAVQLMAMIKQAGWHQGSQSVPAYGASKLRMEFYLRGADDIRFEHK